MAIDFHAKISFSKVINVNIHNAECDAFEIYIFFEGEIAVVVVCVCTQRLSRWIIKTTTNILILCGNIISQKRDLKSWWTIIMPWTYSHTPKKASLCISQHFYVSEMNFCAFRLHVLSVEKIIADITCEITTEPANVTMSCVWILHHPRVHAIKGVIERKIAQQLDWN